LTFYWRCLPYHYFRYGLYRRDIKFKEIKDYLPESVFYYRILPNLNRNYLLLDNKNICDDILRANNLPIPRLILKIRHGKIFDLHGEIISDANSLNRYLANQKSKEIIAKPADCGSGGKQIEIFEKKEGGYYSRNKKLSYEMISKAFNRDWIFQEVISNIPLLAEAHPNSINSLRVITLFTEKEPLILYAILKMGNNSARTDNAHTEGIYVGVDLSTGRLFDKAYDENLNEFYEHPLTKFKFPGKVIPNFSEVITISKKAALLFPETKIIGWDIALTNNGPIILEGNSSPGLTIIQRTYKGMAKFCRIVYGIIENKK
jgi:hypothetical protein